MQDDVVLENWNLLKMILPSYCSLEALIMYVGNQITAKKNRLLAIVWHTLIIFPLIIVMECKRLKI